MKKSTFIKPRRERIRPGENKETETDAFEIDALELDDMPARYTLVLDQGVHISVKPYTGFFSKTGNIVSTLKNAILRPFTTFWHAVRGKPYTAIDVFLEKRDAKSIYWSFSEGTRIILHTQ